MITVVQDNDIYIVRFPFSRDVIQLIKNVPGRQWDPDHKYWTIPKDRLGFLLAQFKGTPYEKLVDVYTAEHIDENASLDNTSDIPNIDISNIKMAVADGCKIFPHQEDFMRYAIDRQNRGLYSGFILADEQGLGKTLEVMNLALYNRKVHKIKHCLIIACVNSAKYNWIYDIIKHSNGKETPYLLGSRIKRDGTINTSTGSEEKLEDLKCGHMYGNKKYDKLPFFLVMNIEAMRMRRDRHYLIREQLTKLVNKGYIGMIALDEVHRNCLDYNTSIYTDKGLISIGDIVTQNLDVKIWSYDTVTNSFSWQSIVNRFENTLTEDLLKLTFETSSGVKTITCTSSHRFLTKSRGWVYAKDLLDTDDIIEVEGYNLNEETD